MTLGCQSSWLKLHRLRRPTRAEGCSTSGRSWRSRRSKRSGVRMRKAERSTKPGSELEDPFRDENSQILHRLQSLLINTSLSGHTEAASPLSPLHQVSTSSLDYASFYKLRGEPANEGPYQVGEIRLRPPELQVEEQEARKVETRKVRAGSGSPYQVGGMRLRLQRAADGRPVG